jgi:DNA polymerase I-like protein with 3'-5' exonuclease and polymerase domains
MHVSKSEKYWQGVIDAMYEKYYGLAAWHTKIIQEVNRTGTLTTLTGRVYDFKRRGKGEYSVNDITNYPTQGLASEFVAIARCSAFARWKKFYLKDKMLFVNTVHDSIVIDADVKENSKELYDICVLLEDVFSDVPRNFERLFKTAVNVPLSSEVKTGHNWREMSKFDRKEW